MDITQRFSQQLVILLLLTLIALVHGNEFPLTQFPVFSQLTLMGRLCETSVSAAYRVSYGCDLFTPAACLCTDPASSLKIATALRECIGNEPTFYSDISSATKLWASYCLTNAGVSAQDETILQDIPLFTQVTEQVQYCASSVTNSFITRFGCNDYTKAPCLCGASSSLVGNAMTSCIGSYSPDDQQSAVMLWSSYCSVNLAQPAVRSIGAPVSVSATVTTGASSRTSSSTKATGLNLGPTSTPASQTQSSSSSDGQSNGSSSQSSGGTIPWDAIGAVAGVVGVLAAIGIAWWTNRRNQWFDGVRTHLHLPYTSHRPQHMPYGHSDMQNPRPWA